MAPALSGPCPPDRYRLALLGAACCERFVLPLLRLLVALLPLFLVLEPAAALDRLAVAPLPPATAGLLVPPGGVAVPALFQQALEASKAGRFDLALPLWNRVLEQAPQDAAAWSNRGNVQLALGDPLAAIADQDQALLLEPANADPHLNRGTAEEALGRWDAAAADYAWILERNPLDASALYNLGNVQGSRGDWPAARDCFVAAADARPGFAMARSSAALAAFQLGDLEAAEREFRSLIRRYPLFADARAGLTALLWQRGASGEAESNWAAASGLDPRYRQSEWLLSIRRWPPGPVEALGRFLALDDRLEPSSAEGVPSTGGSRRDLSAARDLKSGALLVQSW